MLGRDPLDPTNKELTGPRADATGLSQPLLQHRRSAMFLHVSLVPNPHTHHPRRISVIVAPRSATSLRPIASFAIKCSGWGGFGRPVGSVAAASDQSEGGSSRLTPLSGAFPRSRNPCKTLVLSAPSRYRASRRFTAIHGQTVDQAVDQVVDQSMAVGCAAGRRGYG